MVWSRLRRTLTHWRNWADVGALLFFGWFLVLLFRPKLVKQLQSFLLKHRGLIPHLPHGIATPRVLVDVLSSAGIPIAFAILLLTLLLHPVQESDVEPAEGDMYEADGGSEGGTESGDGDRER